MSQAWTCDRCHRQGVSDRPIHFHRCRPSRTRRRVRLSALEDVDREEIYSKAFHAIEEAVPEDDRLRRIEDDE